MLVCNDISPGRINRLKNILHSYVPRDLRENVTVAQKDATNPSAWASGTFTKILVDAPCSSERHLLHNASEFEKWGTSRSRTNATRQFSILRNSLNFVALDGIVVYATCSVSQLENDALIEKIVRKSKMEIFVEKQIWKIGEETKFGWMVLPDKEGVRWGPLYFSVLRKGAIKPQKKRRGEDDEDGENGEGDSEGEGDGEGEGEGEDGEGEGEGEDGEGSEE